MPAAAIRTLFAAAFALAGAAASATPMPVLGFSGAIGVDPLTAAGGVDQLNRVRGIDPGGRAWVIRKFSASVYDDASIVARGKGLLFSSGEAIATRGGVTHVAATLTCGAADPSAAKFSTAPFPLDPAGNFVIRGFLSEDGVNTAVLPVPCQNPQLLIRAANPTTGVLGGWFAAGIHDGDED